MSSSRFPIATVGHSTRFGAKDGPDPSEAGKKSQEKIGNPMSVREALRRIATFEIEVGKPPKPQDIAAMFSRGGNRMTMAQMMAYRKFTKAIIEGDVKAMQQIEESLDGKVPNVNLNTETSLAELIAEARKELRDEQSSD